MKNLLLLLLTGIILFSCEEVASNDPALQSSVDDGYFRAIDKKIVMVSDEIYLIQGISGSEVMTLKLSNNVVGTYTLGGTFGNYATFENSSGAIYNTNPSGSGEIIVTNSDPILGTMSGSFSFIAKSLELEAINISNGIFYKVAYKEEGEAQNDGVLFTIIDENPFTSFYVDAVDRSGILSILGYNISNSISLKIPMDTETGVFDLLENGFNASYTLNSTEENATSGFIAIMKHDVNLKTIEGEFSFVTENSSVEQGQFIVTYQ